MLSKSLRLSTAILLLCIFSGVAQAADCNHNGIQDAADLAVHGDCNGNRIPDDCDLDAQTLSGLSVPVNLDIGSVDGPMLLSDVTGDGSPDLIASSRADNNLLVLVNQGQGQFGLPPAFYVTGGRISDIVTADFRKNGTQDIVAALNAADSLVLYRNNGDGSFASTLTLPVPGEVMTVTIGDFNHDSYPDVASNSSSGTNVSILLNDGAGGFLAPQTVNVSGGQVRKVAAGDFNGDGSSDLAVRIHVPATPLTVESNRVEVYLRQGNEFQRTATLSLPLYSRHIFTGDFDNDGEADVLAAGHTSFTSSTLQHSLYPGNGLGGFGGVVESDVEVSREPQYNDTVVEMRAADFDEDGAVDLIAATSLSATASSPAGFGVLLERNLFGRFAKFAQTTPISGFTSDPAGLAAGSLSTNGEVEALISGSSGGLFRFGTERSALSADADNNVVPDECQPGLLPSPITTLWNGYLSLINILELVNKGSSPITALVSLAGNDGAERSRQSFPIPAGGQFDVIVNDLPGFSPDSIGLVTVSFSGQLEARMLCYRPAVQAANAFGSYDFVFTLPVEQARKGAAFTAFNTYNPALNPAETGYPVEQWLSIVNLSSEERAYAVRSYSQDGLQIFSTRIVSLRAFERSDLEAGHENPGPDRVGLIEIQPVNLSSPYMAQIIRYGHSPDPGRFSFAVPITARAGYSGQQFVPISRGAGGHNWVETINPLNAPVTIAASFFDNLGNELRAGIDLAPHSQVHFDMSQTLQSGETGIAVINTTGGEPIIVQSMFYFNNSEGAIEAVYSSLAAPAGSGTQTGSYNLYLGMQNWLKLSNTAAAPLPLTVKIGTAVFPLNLGPYETRDLGLHETAVYGTAPDSYGMVQVNSGAGLRTELLRLRTAPFGGVDFVTPTLLR